MVFVFVRADHRVSLCVEVAQEGGYLNELCTNFFFAKRSIPMIELSRGRRGKQLVGRGVSCVFPRASNPDTAHVAGITHVITLFRELLGYYCNFKIQRFDF